MELIVGSLYGSTVIWGFSAQANYIVAGGGNDTLYGGTRADILWGGAGADFIHGAANDIALYGGSGFDTLVFSDQPGATRSISAGGVSIAGSRPDQRLRGHRRSVNGRDVFHITGPPANCICAAARAAATTTVLRRLQPRPT